ncbi:MAG: PD40 domain-containing protein [Planctomycetes bacterium]|nr:PD40 domain-containing protein [Planctomycetota bacterium]
MKPFALLSILLLSPQAEKVSFDEKVLCTIPEGVIAKDVCFFKDGRQAAYRAIAGGKMYVVVNNQKQSEYATIADGISFSPAGKISYRGTNGSQWFAVIGGAPGPGMQSVGIPVFSRDGSKFAYEASRGIGARTDATASTVFINGQKTGDYAACGIPAFSADGSICAHQVRIGKAGTAQRAFRTADAMVVGGKPGPEADEVRNPSFAPKGNRMAYRYRMEYTWTMIIDGKAAESAADIGDAVWSDDGKSVAYRVGERGKYSMVINGKKGPEYPALGEPVWSPDHKTVAYVVTDATKGGEFIVWGDRKSEVYGRVYPPVFSSDGQHMAYGARAENGKYMVVLDDKNGPAEFESIGNVVISPDGKRVAFAGQWNFRWTCAIDSGRASMHDFVQTPVWSPDGKKVAFAGQDQGKWFVEVNYRRGDDYDEVLTAPVFSSDSKKCAYGVRRGPDLLWRVVTVAD